MRLKVQLRCKAGFICQQRFILFDTCERVVNLDKGNISFKETRPDPMIRINRD